MGRGAEEREMGSVEEERQFWAPTWFTWNLGTMARTWDGPDQLPRLHRGETEAGQSEGVF